MDHVDQQIVFDRGQRNNLAVSADLADVGVDRQVSASKAVRFFLPLELFLVNLPLAQIGLNSCKQLQMLDGLYHIIVPAQLQCGNNALAVVEAAQKKNGA